jgi:hypothetical protein
MWKKDADDVASKIEKDCVPKWFEQADNLLDASMAPLRSELLKNTGYKTLAGMRTNEVCRGRPMHA